MVYREDREVLRFDVRELGLVGDSEAASQELSGLDRRAGMERGGVVGTGVLAVALRAPRGEVLVARGLDGNGLADREGKNLAGHGGAGHPVKPPLRERLS